jgi:hypothetical protein
MAPNKLLILLLPFLFIFSCSKEEALPSEGEKTIPPKEEQAIDYLPFEVGQYWIYEGTITDLATGEKTAISKTDSLYIRKDTLINRHQYFLIQGTRLGESVDWLLRPSGTDLLDEFNHLIFTMEQLEETIYWPSSLVPEGVEEVATVLRKSPQLEVPYGSFPALILEQSLYLEEANKDYPDESVIRESIAFGKGVGPARFTRTLPGRGLLIEMQLIRSSID